jgi:hypothetical protein
LRHKFQAVAHDRVKKSDPQTLVQKLYIEQKEIDAELVKNGEKP